MRHLSIPRGRLALGALAVSLLAGCATRPQPLYYWGDYPNVVYSHFQNAKGQQRYAGFLDALARRLSSGRLLRNEVLEERGAKGEV